MRDYRTGAGAFAMILLLSTATSAQPSSTQQQLPPPTQPPAVCPPVVALVCAAKAGQRQTYWNECLAQRDGAIIFSAGDCPDRPGNGV